MLVHPDGILDNLDANNLLLLREQMRRVVYELSNASLSKRNECITALEMPRDWLFAYSHFKNILRVVNHCPV